MANISDSSFFWTAKGILLYVPEAESSHSSINTESKVSSDCAVAVVLACFKTVLFELSVNSATTLFRFFCDAATVDIWFICASCLSHLRSNSTTLARSSITVFSDLLCASLQNFRVWMFIEVSVRRPCFIHERSCER